MIARSLAVFMYWGPFQVLMPFIVKNDMQGGGGDLGVIFSMGGMGAIIGSLLMSRIKTKAEMMFIALTWGGGLFLVSSYAFATNLIEFSLITFVNILFTMGNIKWHHIIHLKLQKKSLDAYGLLKCLP